MVDSRNKDIWEARHPYCPDQEWGCIHDKDMLKAFEVAEGSRKNLVKLAKFWAGVSLVLSVALAISLVALLWK